jgi:predicted kinase
MYAAAANTATYERLRELARSILIGGFNAIVDATFLSKAQRERMRSLAVELRTPFAIAHAEAGEATLRQRIARRAAVELDASEATLDVLNRQLKTQEPIDGDGQGQLFVFDTEHDDDHAQATKAAKMLQRLRAVDSSKM